jgi:carboxyl-terminal processing protease
MILDLRGNPGGSLDNAVGVAGLFIADGPLVSVTTREGRLVKPLEYDIIPPFPDRFAGNPELAHIIANLYGVPLVVLTDNSTGGTAEILAGALKDNKRAVIVGTTTYGRNVSLSREELATGGVLTITTQDYITPISNKVLSAFSVAMLLLGIFLWAMYERQRKQREAERKAAELNKKSGR